MAQCQNCGADVPEHARYCPRCGTAQQRAEAAPLPPLPLSPWGPPPAMQPAGGRATPRAEPQTGPPLTAWHVGIAVGAILLFLAFIVIIGQGGLHWPGSSTTQAGSDNTLPIMGIKGEAVEVGTTIWGVAFTDQVQQVDNKPPQHGQYYAVGIIIGNKGSEPMTLSKSSVGLYDEGSGERFTPTITAWGTPEQIEAGQYVLEYTLPPNKAIAGLAIFDVAPDLSQPRLLVRDLAESDTQFTGMIDLTKESSE